MTAKRLLVLVVLAIALLGGVLWYSGRQAPVRHDAAAGPLLPALEARLNALEEVRVIGAGDAVLVTLRRDGEVWRVAEREGWPADTGKLRGLLLRFTQARRLEPKTALPERYAQLGVEDVSEPAAGGVRLELHGGGEPLAVIVGRNNPQGRGSFVRLPEQAQSWLADADLAVEKDPARWLARDLLDIAARRIVAVEVRPERGPAFRIERRDGDAAGFTLAQIPRGQRLVSDYAPEATAGLFDNLQLDDVRRFDGDWGEPTLAAEFLREDGLRIGLRAWDRDGRLWVVLEPVLDEAQAREFLAAEVEKDRRAVEAAEKPVAGDEGETAAASALDETAKDALLKDADTRLAELSADVQALRGKVDGWAFALPNFKAANLRRDREAYLAPAQ
ncbi:DUF4340 domain-containing protein [Rehaibacterium terrae]|jgi:hypothetical protein|uniref:DUF4340 domain-containing protein n=1 Tax=Rehaibacterium terrae TaxID=1341696 RepID=A0A7W7V6P4_9GAMM|nr:DUF4340 domain-containing protein [Rehaibacterium terrae]MBB5014245.1 hypothetical protein [Rehaibacterium terrae]